MDIENEKYARLIASDIYDTDFVAQFQKRDSYSISESPRTQEANLRHDYVCTLLADREDMPMEILKLPSEPSTSHEGNKFTIGGNSRFILLENIARPREAQKSFAEGLGIPPPKFTWDLIDKHLGVFIEVKVTKCFEVGRDTFLTKRPAENAERYSLWMIDPTDYTVETINYDYVPVGQSDVDDFLRKRSARMAELGISVTSIGQERALFNNVFCDDKENENLLEWLKSFYKPTTKPMSTLEYKTLPRPTLKPIFVEDLLKKLEDPRDPAGREGIVEWNGKIMPEPMVFNIKIAEAKDYQISHFLIKKWIAEIEDPKLQDLLEPLIRGDKINYHFHRNATWEHLMGIGKKAFLYDYGAEDVMQPTYKSQPKKQYHAWFHSLMSDYNCDPELGGFIVAGTLLQEELPTNHPVGKLSRGALKSICEQYCNSFIGIQNSKITALMSKIGGVYHPDPKVLDKHKTCAFIPVLAAAYRKGDQDLEKMFPCHRLCSGLLIRGPHHAKQTTDKINYVIIEMIKKTSRNSAYLKFVKYYEIFEAADYFLVVRQNAVAKIDTSYMTYIHSSIFPVANFMGELILNDPTITPATDLEARSLRLVEENQEWAMERMVEYGMMGLLGTSSEEGMLAGLRKVYMILVALQRRKVAGCYDLDGFCESINECSLDRPLAMYFLVGFLMKMRLSITLFSRTNLPPQ